MRFRATHPDPIPISVRKPAHGSGTALVPVTVTFAEYSAAPPVLLSLKSRIRVSPFAVEGICEIVRLSRPIRTANETALMLVGKVGESTNTCDKAPGTGFEPPGKTGLNTALVRIDAPLSVELMDVGVVVQSERAIPTGVKLLYCHCSPLLFKIRWSCPSMHVVTV